MAEELKWERVKETYDTTPTPTCSTYRAEVPGGWLVAIWSGPTSDKKNQDVNRQTWGGGVAFVPDPTHAWDVATDPRPVM